MKKTGEELKKARLEQNLSLNEVSMATKINARVLEAMEENNSKKLPAKPFLRGFVKTYAEFLKLNSEIILQMFEQDLNPQPIPETPKAEDIKENIAEKPAKKEKPPKKKKVGATKPANLKLPFLKEATITKQIFLVVFVVFLIFMIIFVKGLVEKYQSEKQKALTTPVQEQLEPITPNDTKKEVEMPTPKKVEEKKAVEPKAEEPKPDEPKPQEPVKKAEPAQPEEDAKKPEETQKPEPEPKKEETASASEPKPEETEDKQPESTQPKAKHEVILEAMDAVTINAVIDGKKEASFKLEPGKVHVLKGDKIEVNFSDAGSVNVISNGRYLGVPGDLGQSKTVTYP